MAIRFHRAPDNGRPLATLACDTCPHTDDIANMEGNEGQARRRAQQMGWRVTRRRLVCPACHQNNYDKEASDMKPTGYETPTPSAPAEPTREQKRQIMDVLGEVYDIGKGSYMRGDTDDTVASVLGVMPGWVAKIREEFFGPVGENEDMAALADLQRKTALEMEKALTRLAEIETEAAQIRTAVTGLRPALREMEQQLNRIREAVGARVLKKAGVA